MSGTGPGYVERAVSHAREALKWIGDEPVAVSAPVEAHLSTTYALLAIAEELRDLREAGA